MKPLSTRAAVALVGAFLVAASCDDFGGETFGNKVYITGASVLTLGDTIRFFAGAEYDNSISGPVTRYLSAEYPNDWEWTSSNPAIATVDTLGIVRGVAAGTSLISATHRSVADSVSLQVVPPVHAVVLSPASATVAVNDTATFDATAVDAQLQPIPSIPLTDSGPPGFVTRADRSVSGAVTRYKFVSKGRGEFTITVTAPNAHADRVRKATFTLTVNP